MAEEKKTSKKSTKKVEEVKPEKVEKKVTKKTTPKKEVKEVTDVVVTEKKTPVKKTATKKKVEPKKEEVKKVEPKEEKPKEEKAKAKLVGYNSKTGVPVFENPDGEKPVKFDIKTGKPIYKDEVKEEPVKVEEPKNVEPVKEEPKVDPKKEELKVVPPVVVPPKEEKPIDQSITVDRSTIKSEFDGKLLQLIGWYLLGLLVSVVTLGIGAPFAKCFILNWQYKHTKINGRRLCFDGNGLQLLGNYIKWMFFSVITLGIYLIFLPVAWNKWVVKHTHYEGNRKPVVNYSLFDGTTWDLIGLSILCFFLRLFSLGLLSPFCENLMISWRVNHTTYDTIDMEFDGKGFQLLGNYIKWTFFTIITLGIYGLWVPIKKIKWEVKHTNEKGFSKRPYKPVLGMVLPIILCVVFICGGVFGLAQIDKDQYKEIRHDIVHFVTSIKDEAKKYPLIDVLNERFCDFLYRGNTGDLKITWEERYSRYFDRRWTDKFSNNFYKGDLDEVEMALVDVEDLDVPVLIAKEKNLYRIYWIFEKKIENHYFHTKDEIAGLYLATDSDGDKHLAVVEKSSSDFYHLYYIYDTVNYDDQDIVYALDVETFNERLKNKNITLEKVNIEFQEVDLDEEGSLDEVIDYYYKHTDKEYDVEPTEVRTYEDDYISYLSENMTGEYTVTVLDGITTNKVLVVSDKTKTSILSYDEEVKVTNGKKGYVGVLKNTSSDKKDYVIVTKDNKYNYYYFINTMIKGENIKEVKVKNKSLEKALREKGYKEVHEDLVSVNITNKDDLSNLEKTLKDK